MIAGRTDNPGLRGTTILLAALSLSIGWGIRGNFGHEYGAMVPGCLTAIAVCLLSGREDWRRRVAYFAFFGALGWGFGGSISYMQVISYTHSGVLSSQLYGFACLFCIGFLWAALGGAGTALPAVTSREQLTAFFRPLCWVLAIWLLFGLFGEPLLERMAEAYKPTEGRHESPLYWLDADWLQALLALGAVCCFDLWDRRKDERYWRQGPLAAAFALAGAALGYGAYRAIEAAGAKTWVAELLVRPLGDPSIDGVDVNNLLTNWPQFFGDVPSDWHWLFGAGTGVIVGLALYFHFFGKFRFGASLFAHMAAGWLLCFLMLPVLLGIRMTPPRADDWAGITGVWLGAMLYFLRNGLAGAAFASLVSGFIGGLGFSGAAWLKLMMVAPGNPRIVTDPGTIAAWQHWQSANWHSFLEQSYGFINGIAIAIAIGLLVKRAPQTTDDPPLRPWTGKFAVFFALPFLVFLNLQKNPPKWVEYGSMAEELQAPLAGAIRLSPSAWHTLVYIGIFVAFVYLMNRHSRYRIEVVPASWLGKGQLLYLALLWWMVVGNFERALPQFSAQRLLTEGVITVNAVIVSILILTLPRRDEQVQSAPGQPFGRLLATAALVGCAGAITAVAVQTATVRAVYGDAFAGHAGRDGNPQLRFGPNAEWRIHPNLKGGRHQ